MNPFVKNIKTLVLLACALSSVLPVAFGVEKVKSVTQPEVLESSVRDWAYPRLEPDGSVRFYVAAPDAKTVLVHGAYVNSVIGTDTCALVRGKDGAWTGTLIPKCAGFAYYTLNVDGQPMPDRGSKSFFGAYHDGSGLEVPTQPGAFWETRDVAHGMIQEVRYRSRVSGEYRHLLVYLPPGAV